MTIEKHCLIGKTIIAVALADDAKAIRFDVSDGEPITARADGDCCSNSWIENVENAEALVGTPVLSVADIDMPDSPYDHDTFDILAFYGFKISTAHGECVIDYRNDSNGYYGGSLVWPSADDHHYGGVYGQNVSRNIWKEPLASIAQALE